MAKQHPKKALAALLYINQELSGKEVAEIIDVSENTVSKWNKEEHWDRQRSAMRTTPEKLVLRYYKQSDKIIDVAEEEQRALTTAEVDALAKLAASISKIDKTVSENIVMSVLRNYNNWLLLIDPDTAKANAKHQINYVQTLLDAKK